MARKGCDLFPYFKLHLDDRPLGVKSDAPGRLLECNLGRATGKSVPKFISVSFKANLIDFYEMPLFVKSRLQKE